MKIIIAGGTGFLGHLLCRSCADAGHEIVVLTRNAQSGSARDLQSQGVDLTVWEPDGTAGNWAAALDGSDAVVNLSGESLADGRWTAARKAVLRTSRVLSTRSLAAAVKAASKPPAVVVQGSAIGIYGHRGDDRLTEHSGRGTGFLADLCAEWEAEARPIAERTRLFVIRTGLVLHAGGGVLVKMLPPFKMFAGGRLGSGRQFMSWIHHADWVALVHWAIKSSEGSGAVNATAPAPVTNEQFSRALGQAIGRPSWLPAPAFALRLAFGQMADEALLSGQRVLPARALELGFRFGFQTIEEALAEIFGRR